MSRLVLGPLLRHVGSSDATVWVETDGRCVVEVLGHRENTWSVAGHHYALVCIEGLEPNSSTPYDVRLDGERVWPAVDDHDPPCRIRTLAADRPVHVAFGSCRYARADAVPEDGHFDGDALDAYARKIAALPDAEWPDALVMLGDQVYADETSEATKARIRGRRDINSGSGDQVADFEEYTWLYSESWTDPKVRWLLSTVPSSMIFDDHDVRDDWNTSHSWRVEMQATSWWQQRIIGALSSYWVYQHLGNLSPGELARDELYKQVRSCEADAEYLLREYAAAADREADGAKGARWSYRRDLGNVRLIVIDSRCGRVLAEDSRSMIGDAEFDWIVAQVEGDYDHLLIGTSLPWLLPRALHDIEVWNERLCAGSRGRLLANWSEKFRQTADLEHWASFRLSFERLADLLGRVGRGEFAQHTGKAPATVCVLSGDVHHAYVAQARYTQASQVEAPPVESKIYQLTCSPFHNYVPTAMKVAFRISWSTPTERATSFVLGLIARVPRPSIRWSRLAGPFFGDQIMTLVMDGRRSEVLVQGAGPARATPELHEVARIRLS